MTMPDDDAHMRRAIGLARARVGQTGENPAVGCVLALEGRAIGEGATAAGGRPHAEEQALELAGPAARGAVAYVTLEPCGARSAGQASCAERLIAAGVIRVVVACADASAFAAGRGLSALKAAGIAVETGRLAGEAAGLYADYTPRVS
jgi:pyrimidine deaminase RibD-like protein